MLRWLGFLYGLSGRLRFGGFCKILLADSGVSFVLLICSSALLKIDQPVSLTLTIFAILLFGWGLLSAVIRFGRHLVTPEPTYKPHDREFWDEYQRSGSRAGIQAKGQGLGIVNWAVIFGLFIGVMAIGPGRIARLFWFIWDPVGFTAQTQGDEALADLAVTNPQALQELLTKAQAGDKSAMFFYATFFDPEGGTCRTAAYQPKDPAVAIYWYEKSAALDDQGAERMLGIDYHFGSGVPQDDVQAAALLERAAAKNDDWAEYYLGIMLEEGEGEPANAARAAMLEQESAAQGMSLAQRELGSMYFNGTGVTRNLDQAASYWRQAAAQGDTAAKTLLVQNGMAQ